MFALLPIWPICSWVRSIRKRNRCVGIIGCKVRRRSWLFPPHCHRLPSTKTVQFAIAREAHTTRAACGHRYPTLEWLQGWKLARPALQGNIHRAAKPQRPFAASARPDSTASHPRSKQIVLRAPFAPWKVRFQKPWRRATTLWMHLTHTPALRVLRRGCAKKGTTAVGATAFNALLVSPARKALPFRRCARRVNTRTMPGFVSTARLGIIALMASEKSARLGSSAP